MKRIVLSTALSVGLCGVLAWIPPARGQNGKAALGAQRSAPPLKIAVVDMALVGNEYKRLQDSRDELEASAEASKGKSAKLAEQGRELEKKLRQVKEGTPEYQEIEQKVTKAAGDFDFYKKMADRELKQRIVQAQVDVYREIKATVAKFAEQNGYTLVLQVDRQALAAKSPQSLTQSLQQTIVRHSVDDITDAVIVYLNRQYDAQQGTKTEDEAPASRPSTPPSNRKSPAR